MIAFAMFFILVAVVGASRVVEWPSVVWRMVGVVAVVGVVSFFIGGDATGWRRVVKIFYVAPLVPIYFKTSEFLSFPLHGRDYDSILIAADRLLLGVDPSGWLNQHLMLPPVAIDYLQLCYSIFYFLPIVLGIELYRRMVLEERRGDALPTAGVQLREELFLVVYGFLVSYAAYLLLPAVGPRFTLHDFGSLERELPGWILAHPLREMLNRGENVLPGMTSAAAMHVVTRDAFPSGHTDVTLLTIILAFRYRARLRWIITIIGVSLIFATIYLRYHYFIDLLGGVVLCFVTLALYPVVASKMQRLRDWLLCAG